MDKCGIVNDLKIHYYSVVFARNPMCGKCTRSVPGNSFLWETVSVSNMRINWDDGKYERSKASLDNFITRKPS